MPPSPDARERQQQLDAHRGVGMRVGAREDVEGEGQEPVARQNRGRLVERLVGGRVPAPQIIVVHRRQVVVHQRVTVHTFERRADHQRTFAGHVEQRGDGDHEKRTEALAPIEARVAHSVEQALRARALALDRRRGEEAIDQTLDFRGHRSELRQEGFTGNSHRRPRFRRHSRRPWVGRWTESRFGDHLK